LSSNLPQRYRYSLIHNLSRVRDTRRANYIVVQVDIQIAGFDQ
jgi:hypothetical protein